MPPVAVDFGHVVFVSAEEGVPSAGVVVVLGPAREGVPLAGVVVVLCSQGKECLPREFLVRWL